MTLDEAIIHAKEVASEQRRSGICTTNDSKCDKFSNCIKCAEEHEQLAEWLEDLKRRREYDGELMGSGALNNAHKSGYNEAIDDFASELKSILPIAVHKDCSEIDYEVDYALYNIRFKIDNAVEQLKAGVSND